MSYRDEDRRERERHFFGDVVYEVWRHGGNSDAVDRDTTGDDYRNGLSAEDSASRELNQQRPQPSLPSEEEYFDEQEQEQ
jgi:hypothetical protein